MEKPTTKPTSNLPFDFKGLWKQAIKALNYQKWNDQSTVHENCTLSFLKWYGKRLWVFPNRLQEFNALFFKGKKNSHAERFLFLNTVIYKNTLSGQKKSDDTDSLQDKHYVTKINKSQHVNGSICHALNWTFFNK